MVEFSGKQLNTECVSRFSVLMQIPTARKRRSELVNAMRLEGEEVEMLRGRAYIREIYKLAGLICERREMSNRCLARIEDKFLRMDMNDELRKLSENIPLERQDRFVEITNLVLQFLQSKSNAETSDQDIMAFLQTINVILENYPETVQSLDESDGANHVFELTWSNGDNRSLSEFKIVFEFDEEMVMQKINLSMQGDGKYPTKQGSLSIRLENGDIKTNAELFVYRSYPAFERRLFAHYIRIYIWQSLGLERRHR